MSHFVPENFWRKKGALCMFLSTKAEILNGVILLFHITFITENEENLFFWKKCSGVSSDLKWITKTKVSGHSFKFISLTTIKY